MWMPELAGWRAACLTAAAQSPSLDWLEVVLLEVLGDLLAEHGALRVGGAEGDARPHSCVDGLVKHVGEPVEAPVGTGFGAVSISNGDPVGTEEVLERVDERTGYAGVARGMVGERRRDERRRGADRRRWGEQRPPRGGGFGGRGAVGVGLADRRDWSPKLPVVLIIPTANGGVCSSHGFHRKQARAANDVQPLLLGEHANHPMVQGVGMFLPKDRSIGLIRGSSYAGKRAELFDLVKIFCVFGTGKRVGPVGAEHLCA